MTDPRDEEWYTISSNRDDGIDADREWSRSIRETQYCSGAVHRKAQFIGTPLDVVCDSAPRTKTIDRVGHLFPHIHNDFAELLGDALAVPEFSFGRMLTVDGREYADYQSLMASRTLPIRGTSPESVVRHCPTCGLMMYFPKPFGSNHLVLGDFWNLQHLFRSHLGDFVISGWLLSRFDLSWRKKFFIRKMELRDEPTDGVAEFPYESD